MASKRRGGLPANAGADQAGEPAVGGRYEADPSGAETGNRNGHHHDDRADGLPGPRGGGDYKAGRDGGGNHHEGGTECSGGDRDRDRAGPSQSADLRQADPTLPASDVGEEEAAAQLWEEFEALGIHVRRAEPVFPPRPWHGAAGKRCVVRANHFLARIVDEGLHHYDVTISPEPTPKGGYREVMAELVSVNQHTELGGRFPAYDGRDSLFTAGALPFDSKEFEVTLSASVELRRTRDRKYKVVIKHAAAISLLQLRMLLAGYPTDIPRQALQVLDTGVCGVVFRERHMEYIKVDQSLAKDGTLGVEGWKGLYLSIWPMPNSLSVLADVSSSVFIQPLLLIDFIQSLLKIDVLNRKLTKPEYAKLLKAVRGVKIEVTHRGDERRKYRIAGLSVKPTELLSFKLASRDTKTVIDHFRETYNLELKFKFLPCVHVGSEQKPVYFPMEVCKIVPRRHYHKKLDGIQVSTLRNLTGC